MGSLILLSPVHFIDYIYLCFCVDLKLNIQCSIGLVCVSVFCVCVMQPAQTVTASLKCAPALQYLCESQSVNNNTATFVLYKFLFIFCVCTTDSRKNTIKILKFFNSCVCYAFLVSVVIFLN